MAQVEKKLTGKKLAAIAIAVIIIIAALVSAWYFFYLVPAVGLKVSISPGEVEPGGTVTVSGSGAPASVEVTLTYSEPDSNLTRAQLGLEPVRRTFTRTVTSDSDGKFTDTFSSDVAGKWTVTASTGGETSDPVDFYIFVSPPIKIGVIGPMEWIQGMGMREGAMLAAEKINDAGGFLRRKVVIFSGDEGAVPERGTAEVERLLSDEKVYFVFGGFRTEITEPMRDKAMDYRVPFFITGSATTWLIDCATTTWGVHRYPCIERTDGCVRDNYERYKYTFRVMPTNTDVLFSGFLVPYMRDYFIPKVLKPALVEAGKIRATDKVNVSIVVEALGWTEELRYKLDLVGPLFFGGDARIVSKVGEHLYYGVSPLTKDFSTILADIKARDTHLIFEAFSGEEGLAFIKQWRDLKVPAIPLGINVLSMESEMWEWTEGRVEYEAFLGTMGTRTPVSPQSVPFWDAYVEKWGHAPIYTSFGSYDGIMAIKEIVEQAAPDIENETGIDISDPVTWEARYEDRSLYDFLIPYIEKMERVGLLGRAKFTKSHDIFTGGWNAIDKGQEDYVKPLVLQWRKADDGGRMAVVSAGKGSHTRPDWAPYVEDFAIPPWVLD